MSSWAASSRCLLHRQTVPGCGRAATAATVERAAHGYEQTREAAMAAFAKAGGRRATQGPARMLARSNGDIGRAAHGYAETREDAMAVRRELAGGII
jgi:hypothetical protein